MSEHDTQSTATAAESPDEDSSEPAAENQTGRIRAVGGREPTTYLLWGAFLVSVVLAVISAFSLYFQVGALIGIWIAPRYQPIFRSGFDLAVLLLASYSALSFANLLGVRD